MLIRQRSAKFQLLWLTEFVNFIGSLTEFLKLRFTRISYDIHVTLFIDN